MSTCCSAKRLPSTRVSRPTESNREGKLLHLMWANSCNKRRSSRQSPPSKPSLAPVFPQQVGAALRKWLRLPPSRSHKMQLSLSKGTNWAVRSQASRSWPRCTLASTSPSRTSSSITRSRVAILAGRCKAATGSAQRSPTGTFARATTAQQPYRARTLILRGTQMQTRQGLLLLRRR